MRLQTIRLRAACAVQAGALARLTLATFAGLHTLGLPFAAWLRERVAASADGDGMADAVALLGVQVEADRRWRELVGRWGKLIERGRGEAAALAGGLWMVQHNGMMASLAQPVSEAARPEPSPNDWLVLVRLWEARRERALAATAQRVHGDGLVLSQRIWRLEQDGLTEMRIILSQAFAERTNAMDLARQLEGMLGIDQDIPRWANDRLYRMTPTERMESSEGLLRGPEGRGQGVAYKALRVARTELQYANHAVTTEIAVHNPAVTGRKVQLSAGHPKIDICDTYASGGPYPKSDQILPLHPNCMCFYEDVLMNRADFGRQVRGWMRGENQFLDEYAGWLGMNDPTEPAPWGLTIGDALVRWTGIERDAQAMALGL